MDFDVNIASTTFYDQGRKHVDKPFKTLDQITSEKKSGGREIIKVDLKNDKVLNLFVETACQAYQAKFATTLKQVGLENFKFLAKVVHETLNQGDVKKHITHLQDLVKKYGRVLELGRITTGVCRHRAILYKVLCDAVSQKFGILLKCRLVRYWF